MARIIKFRAAKDRNGMRIGGTEAVVFAMMAVALVLGGRYYFKTYRTSPAFTLGQFFAAVKSGNVEAQYALLDESDKRFYPDQKSYSKTPLAHGYSARIENVSFGNEKADVKNADMVTIDTAISVRGTTKGKELYQQSSQSIQDSYTMRKSASGEWKVVLSMSKLELPNKVEASPQGDSIGNN